jgi:hypothetical protein
VTAPSDTRHSSDAQHSDAQHSDARRNNTRRSIVRGQAGALVGLWLSLVLSGCVRAYRPPSLEEPHAVLKLRRSYAAIYGERLSEVLLIDKRRAFSRYDAAGSATLPRNAAVLIHPKPAQIVVGADFTHQEWRWISETYYETEYFTVYDSYQRRSVTQSRQVPRTRMVQRLVTITDARCKAKYGLEPEAGRTYLLQYTFQDDEVCQLACYEQLPGPGDTFQQVRCPSLPDR